MLIVFFSYLKTWNEETGQDFSGVDMRASGWIKCPPNLSQKFWISEPIKVHHELLNSLSIGVCCFLTSRWCSWFIHTISVFRSHFFSSFTFSNRPWLSWWTSAGCEDVRSSSLQNRFHEFLEKMITAWALIIWASTRFYILIIFPNEKQLSSRCGRTSVHFLKSVYSRLFHECLVADHFCWESMMSHVLLYFNSLIFSSFITVWPEILFTFFLKKKQFFHVKSLTWNKFW